MQAPLPGLPATKIRKSNSRRLEYNREYARVLRERDREKYNESHRNWDRANADKRKKRHRAYRENNLEKVKRSARGSLLRRRYGLSEEDYLNRLEAQGGVCAGCHSPNPRNREFNVDHDHRTGFPRGLLCDKCNMAIGLLDDSPDRLQALIDYLKHWASLIIGRST